MYRNILVGTRDGEAVVRWPGVVFAIAVTTGIHWLGYSLIRIGGGAWVGPRIFASALTCVALISIVVRVQLWWPPADLPRLDERDGD